jgi:hypothetical protein
MLQPLSRVATLIAAARVAAEQERLAACGLNSAPDPASGP